jgi:single-stranded-DNA-specific exonuclease
MVRWRVLDADEDQVRRLADQVDVSPLIARLLLNRGVTTAEEAERFLDPQLSDLHDPLLLPDCAEAVKEVVGAVERKEPILVHGDYDADGITASALWGRCLRKMGANVHIHLPNRQKEGYGVHESALHRAKELGAKLLLTCDCGTAAHEVVAQAREMGMRVVVTDHHEPEEQLPPAQAVVNPRRADSRYPFPDLSGVGVSFKVASAVVAERGLPQDRFHRAYLDLAALGTVCDIVPLRGENRVLVSHGLPKIVESRKAGLRALVRVTNYAKPGDQVTARDAAFIFGPRINAAGRMDDAHDALALLTTDDKTEALDLARTLDRRNWERQQEQKRIHQEAVTIIEEQGLARNRVVLVAAEGWNPGVVGIVASKLVEDYWRPALVGCRANGIIGGSARSIPPFDLYEALSANRDLFLSCGGHRMAAGFSFEEDRLEDVRAALCAHADRVLTDEDLIPEVVADARVYPHEVTDHLVASLERFAPFGEGNPEPLFLGRRVTILSVEPTRNPAHPRVTLRGDGTNPIYGMAFGLGERLAGLPSGAEVDMMFQPTYDYWRGQKRLRWFVRDIREPGAEP